MKYFLYLFGSLIFISACQPQNSTADKAREQWLSDSISMIKLYAPSSSAEKTLDQLMPFIGRKHDSIPTLKRFDPQYQSYFTQHKSERLYQVIYQHLSADSIETIMVRRLEPSIKNDKYAVVCAQYKRLPDGQIDTASFEELFWSWKMPLSELHPKAAKLFKAVVNHEDLKPYIPGKEEDLYIMFPDAKVTYNKAQKSWTAKDTAN